MSGLGVSSIRVGFFSTKMKTIHAQRIRCKTYGAITLKVSLSRKNEPVFLNERYAISISPSPGNIHVCTYKTGVLTDVRWQSFAKWEKNPHAPMGPRALESASP